MDKNTVVVYYPTMDIYYNPNVRILFMKRCTLRKWYYDHPKFPFWRLYWNSMPGAIIRYKKQIIALTPERLVLVPPNTEISQRLVHGPATHFGAHFLTDAPFNRLHSKIYVFKAEAGMLSAIKALPVNDGDLLTNNLSLIMAVRGLIHLLLSKIPAAELQPLQIPEQLAENMAFIDANSQRPLSNQEIARHMGLSVNAMLRHYKRELGISPQRYLRQKRIEKACMLLHDPQRSIKQIAEETGFCDRYYFTKVFTAFTGQSPARFRAYARTRI